MEKHDSQFVSALVIGGDPKQLAVNSYPFEHQARDHADRTYSEAFIRGIEIDVLLVDTYRRAVEALNGSKVNLFTSVLDEKFPGWHINDVDRPIDKHDVSEKILEAFENPNYQALLDTPEIIEFVVTNFPFTFDEELKRLIEREEELDTRGSLSMRYIILFNQPSEQLIKSNSNDIVSDIQKVELEDGIDIDSYREQFKDAYKVYAELEFHKKFNCGDDVSFKELDDAKHKYSQLVHLTLKALIESNSEVVLSEFYKTIVSNPFLRPHKDWFIMFFQHLQQDVIAFKLDNRDWDFPIRWKLTSTVPH